ncbi:hypothetical protein, variant [Saprolegnia diclina VS20]|nr:hypothetical protein, variant [Saprolegnia diclina VS20]EQC34880.1 hypothetical protein, variant [Saprolegnia diclina VS20]|eukprot:XP_008611752.1 hypothetical protein, variant [Saprolegnia diclina VS20]
MGRRWWPLVVSWTLCFLLLLELPRLATPTHLDVDDPQSIALEALTAKSSRVLHWGQHDYHRFVLQPSRPYGLVVLVTAAASSYKCDMCRPLEDEFKIAAGHYAQHRERRRNASPLYFVILDADRIRDFFIQHKIKNVPLLGYLEPKENDARDGTVRLSATNTVPNAASIIEYCNVVHATDIPRPVYFRRTFTISSILALAFSGSAHYMCTHLASLLELVQSRQFWFAVSMGIYGISVGGLVFSATTALPPLPPGERVPWFHPHLHQQYLGEALIVIFLNSVIAYCLIKLLEHKPARTAATGSVSPFSAVHTASPLSLKTLHETASHAFHLSILLYTLSLVCHIFATKYPHYSVWATLPSFVQSWVQLAYVSPIWGWFFQLLDKLRVWLLRPL